MELAEIGKRYGWLFMLIITIAVLFLLTISHYFIKEEDIERKATSDKINYLMDLAEECNATEEIIELKQAKLEIGNDNSTAAERITGNVARSLRRKNCITGLAIGAASPVVIIIITIVVMVVIIWFFMFKR